MNHVNTSASRACPLATFVLLLATMLLPAVPALAGDCCPDATVDTIGTLSDHDIRAVQLCLVEGDFYDDSAAFQVDGIVGNLTLQALAKAQKQCSAAPPAPSPEPAPPEPSPKPKPYAPATCEDKGQFVSYVLTAADLADLAKPPPVKPPANPPAPANPPTNPPCTTAAPPNTAAVPPAPKLTPEFLASLAMMQDAEYPSHELFANALNYFTRSIGTADQVQIVAEKACKVHVATDTAAGWAAKSDVPMTYDLSHASYGFYPYWLGNEGPVDPKVIRTDTVPIDFSVLTRIEWFGVTFSHDGKLDISPFMHQSDSTVFRKTTLARSYDTGVDLVVYRREADWSRIISGDPSNPGQMTRSDFIDRLAGNIATEVGTPLTGFLDRLQNWFPSAFRTSPTFWDGATLYFDGYPFDDPDAMQFLVDLLRATRSKLSAQEHWDNFPNTNKRHLALNVVVPFCAIFSNASCPKSSADPTAVAINYLRPLVPKTLGDSGTADDAIDAFIVFLPESTSVNKMALRGQIEQDFSSDADKAAMKPDESLAAWRKQMLRKISYVLFPATSKWKGAFSEPGMQFREDVIYSQDNFQGVGLWPLPTYGDANKQVAADMRSVFIPADHDWVQMHVVPLFVGAFGPGFADFFMKDRRVLFLVVAILILLLVIYALCAFWIIELREFWQAHLLWCMLPIVLVVLILGFQFLFDRALSAQFMPFLIVLIIVGFGGWLVRRTFRSEVQKDLP